MSDPIRQILLDRINAVSDRQFLMSEVNFQPPQVNVDGPKNSILPVTPAASLNMVGQVDFTYNRVALSDFFEGIIEFEYSVAPTSTLEIIPLLQGHTPALLTESDIVDAVVPAADQDGKITVELQAAAGSYGWIGSKTIVLVPSPSAFADNFNSTDLEGLTTGDLTPAG